MDTYARSFSHSFTTYLTCLHRVPIMSFDFDRVSIDLAFAQLLDNYIPAKLGDIIIRYSYLLVYRLPLISLLLCVC